MLLFGMGVENKKAIQQVIDSPNPQHFAESKRWEIPPKSIKRSIDRFRTVDGDIDRNGVVDGRIIRHGGLNGSIDRHKLVVVYKFFEELQLLPPILIR